MTRKLSAWTLWLLVVMATYGQAEDAPTEVRKFGGFVAPVQQMAVSPDGRWLATASQGISAENPQWHGDARIWDLEFGKLVRKFAEGPDSAVWAVAFHPSGERLVTLAMKGKVVGWKSSSFLWEVSSGRALAELSAHQVQFSRDVAFTGDGKQIVTNSYKLIMVADANTGREVRRISGLECDEAIALSADGRFVASSVKDEGNYVQVWDFTSGQRLHSTSKAKFGAGELKFSPKANRLLVCRYQAAELLDCNGFTRIAELGDMRRGTFSPDGRLVLTSDFASVLHLWDSTSGKLLLKFKAHPHHVGSIAFLRDGRHVLCSGGLNRKEDVGKPSESFDVVMWRLPDSVIPKVEAPTIPKRPAVPEAAVLEKSRTEIKQIFKSDYAKATKADAKLELARKLLGTAETSDAPDARYALLTEARELAMSAGGVDVVEKAFELRAEYDGDSWPAQVESLKALAVSTKSPTDLVKLADLFLERISQAITNEEFDSGVELAKAANIVTPKLKDTSSGLREEIKHQQDRVTHLKKLSDDARAARLVLEKSPDDPAANEKVGRYLCLGRDDWSAGLSYLAKAADAKLKSVAESDQSSPADTTKQLDVADAWFELAKSAKTLDRPALLARAKLWYEQAAPNATGLTKVRIEARLKELAKPSESERPAKGTKKTAKPNERSKVDLRPEFDRRGLAVREQGKRGACQVFAFLGPLEFQLSQPNRPLDLSEQFLMWAANDATGIDRIEGHNPDLLIKGLQKYGICQESMMPYVPRKEPIEEPSVPAKRNAVVRAGYELVSIKHWKSEIGFSDQDLRALRETLAQRQPITATFCWPQGLYDEQLTDRQALLIDRNVDGESKSGHGVVLVGYELNKSVAGGGYFIVRNSWGEKFADRGHLAISFDYAKRYGIDAYFVRCTPS